MLRAIEIAEPPPGGSWISFCPVTAPSLRQCGRPMVRWRGALAGGMERWCILDGRLVLDGGVTAEDGGHVRRISDVMKETKEVAEL